MWEALNRSILKLEKGDNSGAETALASLDLSVRLGGNLQGYSPLHVVALLGGWSILPGLQRSSSSSSSPSSFDLEPGKEAKAVKVRVPFGLLTKFLLRRGFDPEAKSTQLDLTPLHVASIVGAVEVADVLLSEGNARLDARDSNGNTALHLAAASGFRCVLEVLLAGILEHRVSHLVSESNNNGETALGVARSAGNGKLAELLNRFLSMHVAGETVPKEQIAQVTEWLEKTVRLPAYIDGFISHGYTRLDLWSEIGMSDEDFALIGVKQQAHRKQIRYFLELYKTEQLESEDENESESDASASSSESDESSDGS